MKQRFIDCRGAVKLLERTLSDGSFVYDVEIGSLSAIIHCVDESDAINTFTFLSSKSITVFNRD